MSEFTYETHGKSQIHILEGWYTKTELMEYVQAFEQTDKLYAKHLEQAMKTTKRKWEVKS